MGWLEYIAKFAEQRPAAVLTVALVAGLAALTAALRQVYRDRERDRTASASRDAIWADKLDDLAKMLAEITGRLEAQSAMVLAMVARRRNGGDDPRS